MSTSDDFQAQERIIFFPLVTVVCRMLLLCSSGQFSAPPLLPSWAVEELSQLSAGKKERVGRMRREGAKRRPRDRGDRGAARREIICSETELEPDAGPLIALHFLDLERIILLSNLDPRRRAGCRGHIAPSLTLLPLPTPQLRAPPRDWLAPPGPSPIGARQPGLRGLKRGAGAHCPAAPLSPPPCARRAVGAGLAASLCLPPLPASHVRPSPVSGSRGRAREDRGRCGPVPGAGTAGEGRGPQTPRWPPWWPRACR